MTISVLMSVYRNDKPSQLERALQSVWDDQTLKPTQIVLIKDGPLGDDLDNVVTDWETRLPEVMTVLQNEQNLGLTCSLNKGLKVAIGELIARMDADDISMPRRFEQQTKFLTAHPEISVCGGWLQEFDETDSCLNVRRYPDNPDEIRKYICKASPLAHPTVMLRRSIFEDNGIRYNEKYRTSQDLALWFDVLACGLKISNLQEVTIRFRRDADVFKRRSRKKALNEFKIYMDGIYRLNGVLTWRYAYPLARLIFRLMPVGLIKSVYSSPLRRSLLDHKSTELA